jgi:uncharacterized delta-60 repeat protein
MPNFTNSPHILTGIPGGFKSISMRTAFTLAAALVLTTLHTTAQNNWTLDNSFGTNGKVVTLLNPPIMEKAGARVSLIQPDGKIVALGFAYDNLHIVLMRYKPDGTLDSSFGMNGVVEASPGPWNSTSVPADMVLQPDGKIVVAGYVFNPDNPPLGDDDFFLLRYHADGTADSSFGTNGEVITNVNGENNQAVSLVLRPDGKILLGGGSYISTAILRYNADGTIDGMFGAGGVLLISLVPNAWTSVANLALQPDGKIIGAGYTVDTPFGGNNFAVARFDSIGYLDPTFGTNGVATIEGGRLIETITSIILQPDGKILAGGWSMDSANYDDCHLLRLMPDGSPDSSFGTNGVVISPLSDKGDLIRGMVLQPDGKIITSGEYYSGSSLQTFDYDFMLARYNTDGTRDTGFGTNGLITTDFGTEYDISKDVSLQTDGKIVVVGESGANPAFALARYTPDGTSAVFQSGPSAIGNVMAYPNPVTDDQLTLAYELRNASTITVRITNLSGAYTNTLINHQARPQGTHKEILTLPEYLVPGVYLLQIINGNGMASISILKK